MSADHLEAKLTAAFEALAELSAPTGADALELLRAQLGAYEPPTGAMWHLAIDDRTDAAWTYESDDERVMVCDFEEPTEAMLAVEIGLVPEAMPDTDGVYAWRLVLAFPSDEDEPWTRQVLVEEGRGQRVLTAFDPSDELGEAFVDLAERPLVGVRCEPFTPF